MTINLMLVGPSETLYEGGFFSAKLEFPQDFPNSPPVMTFKTQIWHPNGICCLLNFNSILRTTVIESLIDLYMMSILVYENGKVCISILHPPGEDRFNELVSLSSTF